ncbi:hypothetical protein PYCC9005_001981 [Savitreella phatthalungensis]
MSHYGGSFGHATLPTNGEPYPLLMPLLRDPFSLAERVSFEYFQHWLLSQAPQTPLPPPDGLKERYAHYLTDLTCRTARAYVATHSSEAWFADLYSPQPESRPSEKLVRESASVLDLQSFGSDWSPYASQGQAGFPMDEPLPEPTFPQVTEANRHIVLVRNVPALVTTQELRKFIEENAVDVDHLSLSSTRSRDGLRYGMLRIGPDSSIDSAIAAVSNQAFNSERAGQISLIATKWHGTFHDKPIILFPQLDDDKVVNELWQRCKKIIDDWRTRDSTDGLDLQQHLSKFLEGASSLESSGSSNRYLLDITIEFMRHAYFFDFWTMRRYASLEDVLLHAPSYKRSMVPPDSPAAAAVLERYTAWRRKFDAAWTAYSSPEDGLAAYSRVMGRIEPAPEHLPALLRKVEEKEDRGWRCLVPQEPVCRKLFQSQGFLDKHIAKRHGGWLAERVLAAMLANYLLDQDRPPSYAIFNEPPLPPLPPPGMALIEAPVPQLPFPPVPIQPHHIAAAKNMYTSPSPRNGRPGQGNNRHRYGPYDRHGHGHGHGGRRGAPGAKDYRDLDASGPDSTPELNY